MNRLQRFQRFVIARWDLFAAALFGVAYLVALTDLRVLDPFDVDVVSAGDPAHHAIGLEFARWDAWHWPLARIENYMWPVGTSAVFTDSNPWLVLLAKLLLPRNTPPVQLNGPWLALVFALQGWCGARLTARATGDQIVRALGGALFVLSPALAFRLPHEALCAHFLVLVVLEAAITPRSDPRGGNRALARVVAALVFASGLHPTIFAIVIPLAAVAVARHVAVRSPSSVALLVSSAVGPALVWWSFGTLGARETKGTVGFGYFSTNLLSLIDPMENTRSVFLPPLPHGPGQYEGIAYLGAGVLILVAIATARGIRRLRARDVGRPDRWTWAIGAALTASTIFALSSLVRFGDWLVVDLTKLYEPLSYVTGAFRSSGRFVWPLHYMAIATGIFAAAKLRAPVARALLVVAVLVQLVDARHVDGRAILTLGDPPAPTSAAWRLAGGTYARLVIDPPDLQGGFDKCPEIKNTPGSFLPLARVATREKLVFNSGVSSRFDAPRTIAYCEAISRDRHEGRFDAQTIYAPEPHVADAYLHDAALTCGRLDGRPVCVRSDRATPLQRLLADARGPELPLAAHDLLASVEGIGGVEEGVRWADDRAVLHLKRPGAGASYFAFVARFRDIDIANRTPSLRVAIDGHEAERIHIRHPTVSGVYRIDAGMNDVEVRLSVRGTLTQTGDAASYAHLWQLVRVEWFAAE